MRTKRANNTSTGSEPTDMAQTHKEAYTHIRIQKGYPLIDMGAREMPTNTSIPDNDHPHNDPLLLVWHATEKGKRENPITGTLDLRQRNAAKPRDRILRHSAQSLAAAVCHRRVNITVHSNRPSFQHAGSQRNCDSARRTFEQCDIV